MGRRSRTCYICGESYQYCPTCSQDRTKPSWMAEFHSANCVKIFDIATRFNSKKLTKEEAKKAMEKCDLSNKANFKPFIQRDLENIFKVDEAPKPKRGKRAEMKIIIDDAMDVEPVVVQSTVEELVIEQPVEVVEPVAEETTAHEVVLQENNE